MTESDALDGKSPDIASRLRALEDRAEICELKAHYFRAVDTHDWALLESLFVPGAAFDAGRSPAEGAAAFAQHVSKFHGGNWSSHHGHMPEITIEGDSASGIWAMETYVGRPAGKTSREYGHYREIYVRTPDGWRISSLAVTLLRAE
jgi:hypothetical protein